METVSNDNLTVKQLADELGVSPQGINKYLRTSGLQERAIKNGNRFLIPEELAVNIRNHFQKTETKTETKIETETDSETEISNESKLRETKNENESVEGKAIEALTEQLSILQKQLEIKDRQIETLTDALANANEANKALSAANAVYVAAEKKDLLLAEVKKDEESLATVEEHSRKWWQFWKN